MFPVLSVRLDPRRSADRGDPVVLDYPELVRGSHLLHPSNHDSRHQ